MKFLVVTCYVDEQRADIDAITASLESGVNVSLMIGNAIVPVAIASSISGDGT